MPRLLHLLGTRWATACAATPSGVVTEHGQRADDVRNVEADPRVRVKVGGRWRTGTAHVTDEDPLLRLRRPVNDALLLAVGTVQLVLRVDLDP